MAADLDSIEEELKAVLGLEVAYSDLGLSHFGLKKHHAADRQTVFLEVVTPIEGTTPRPGVFSNAVAVTAATW